MFVPHHFTRNDFDGVNGFTIEAEAVVIPAPTALQLAIFADAEGCPACDWTDGCQPHRAMGNLAAALARK